MTKKQPQHVINIRENIEEVERLFDIPTQISGKGPGYKHDVQVLNKSALVLLVACWESYIEDLAQLAFETMLKNAESPNIFPKKVLTLASKKLKDDPNETKIWDLAGDNWKNVLSNHKSDILKKYVTSLNTPRPEQINSLFKCLIGMNNISSFWYWRGMSNENARRKLSSMVTLRGSIAHRVATSKSVTKKYVSDHSEFIKRLVIISNNRVVTYLEKQIGKEPWDHYVHGKTQ